MKRCLHIIALGLLAVTSGCRHKDLYVVEGQTMLVDVVFDWRNAPDADPSAMVLRMYNRDDGSMMRYMFQNKTGGTIKVPYGNYDAICLNGDINDWAHLRNTDDIETYEVYTSDATELQAIGVNVASVSRDGESAAERMAQTPKTLLTDRQDRIELPVTTTRKTITLYPDDKVCHYTVDIYDVENTGNLHDTAVDGVLSGMAEGHLVGQKTSTDAPVSMPFLLSRSGDDSLHAEFLTFGETAHGQNVHKLTLYIMLTDGSRWSQTFDVSQQIYDAPDPRHVHIVIRGVKLPDTISHSGGLHPDVNGWVSERIDFQM